MKTQPSQGAGWVAIQLGLMTAQLLSVYVKRKQWPAPASGVTGAALVAAAAAYGLPRTRSLGRNRTPLPEPKVDGELVTTGIYAHVPAPALRQRNGSQFWVGAPLAELARTAPRSSAGPLPARESEKRGKALIHPFSRLRRLHQPCSAVSAASPLTTRTNPKSLTHTFLCISNATS